MRDQTGMRKHAYGMRHPTQGDLNGDGDLLFYLFRGMASKQGNHRDLDIRDVWKGFDGERLERHYTRRDKQGNYQQQEQRLVQGKGRKALDHTGFSTLWLEEVIEQQHTARHHQFPRLHSTLRHHVTLGLMANLDLTPPKVPRGLFDKDKSHAPL